MASQQSGGGEPRPTERPMSLQRGHGVGGATGVEPASRSEHGREESLVAADRQHEHSRDQTTKKSQRCNSRGEQELSSPNASVGALVMRSPHACSAFTSVPGLCWPAAQAGRARAARSHALMAAVASSRRVAVAAGGRMRTTTSTPGDWASRSVRIPRTCRRTRLRVTAGPTERGIAKATLPGARSEVVPRVRQHMWITMRAGRPPVARTPRRKTREMSADRRRRKAEALRDASAPASAPEGADVAQPSAVRAR